MKILVTGGTGFLGQHVVRKLGRHKVTILSRRASGKNAKMIAGDITNIDDVEKAFPVDVVIHLAASLDEHYSKIFETNVEGTRNIVELCKKYKTKHLVYMSSTAVFGPIKIARENSPKNPRSRYEKSKREAEDIVAGSGLNYTIIRAPVIIGPSDVWLDIIKAAKKRFPLIGRGDNHFHVAYVEDVALLIAKSCGNRKAFGQVFHVATTDRPTYKEFYAMLCNVLGIEMTKKSVPVFAAKTMSAVHETVSRMKGKRPKPTLARSNIERLTRDRIVSAERAKKILGFSPKYDTRKSITATVNYFKKSGLI